MEKGVVVAPLRLERWIPLRDVRRRIWSYLLPIEIQILHHVHSAAHRTLLWKDAGAIEFCRKGYLKLLQWLVKDGGMQWSYVLTLEAIKHSHMKILYWRVRVDPPQDFGAVFQGIAFTDRVDLMEWFRNRFELDFANVAQQGALHLNAASGGSVRMLSWLWTYGVPNEWLCAELLHAAVTRHRLNAMDWLFEETGREYPILFEELWCKLTVHGMKSENVAEILDWLRRRDVPCPRGIFEDPHGRPVHAYSLDAVKWLYERGIAAMDLDRTLAALAAETWWSDTELRFIRWFLPATGVQLMRDHCIELAKRANHVILDWVFGTSPQLIGACATEIAAGFLEYYHRSVVGSHSSKGAQKFVNIQLKRTLCAMAWLDGTGATINGETHQRMLAILNLHAKN